MALSEMERQIEKAKQGMLNPIKESSPVNEEASKKLVDLKTIGLMLDSANLPMQERFSSSNDNDISVKLFLMSTKKVQVPADDNFFSLGFRVDPEEERITVYSSPSTETTIEEFLELPMLKRDRSTIDPQSIVQQCDTSRIYNLYLDRSLGIMRKMFPYPYHMMTGPNLVKQEQKSQGLTLYVTFDPVRKKFKYVYNPDFILYCAIDEWMINKSSYKSFEDCYIYILTFMMTHEMLHIIHHNTLADGTSGDDYIDAGDHTVANIVQDSFINCKIARRYLNVSGINKRDGLAPMPKSGIGSNIIVRCEHNSGLKKIKDMSTLEQEIVDLIQRMLKYDNPRVIGVGNHKRNMEKYAGADVFIDVDISAKFSPIRSNGSNVYQRCVNEIIKLITDAKVHDGRSKMSNEEKVSDLDVLPNGTLVMVKGTRDICTVDGYDESTGIYELNKAVPDGVRQIPAEGAMLNVTIYKETDTKYGRRKRHQIRPYNPEDDAYVDTPKTEQNNQQEQQNPQGQQGQGEQQGTQVAPKSLSVGDIVWVRKKKRFGKIVSIDNGIFHIVEMEETPAKIISSES